MSSSNGPEATPKALTHDALTGEALTDWMLDLVTDVALQPPQRAERAQRALRWAAGATDADCAAVFRWTWSDAQPTPSLVRTWGASPAQHDLLTRYTACGSRGDPLTARLVSALETPERARVTRRVDLVPDEMWYAHAHVERWRRPLGFDATGFADVATGPDEVWSLTLYRAWGRPRFERPALEALARVWKHVVRLITATEDDDEVLATLRLTRREIEVARLVCKGLSNRRVARLLEISPETVKTHVREVFRKAGVSSRTELAYLLGDPLIRCLEGA